LFHTGAKCQLVRGRVWVQLFTHTTPLRVSLQRLQQACEENYFSPRIKILFGEIAQLAERTRTRSSSTKESVHTVKYAKCPFKSTS
jgi:hypothetical protein